MATRALIRPLLVAVLVWVVGVAVAGAQRIEVTASETEITIEQQVLLVVRVTDARGVEPELPVLEGFRVTPAGQESQMSFSNGRTSSSVGYRFLLTPERTGTFEIGAATIEVDGQTYSSRPFEIRVLEASATPKEQRDLFVTARVSTTTPYVGQQVIHVWRFYRRVQVADASLEPPAFDGFLVEDLGKVREYQATVEGQQYLVSEIRRALFPQEAGTLEIAPSQLTAQVVVQSRDGRRRSLFDDFFPSRNTERRVLRGPRIELEVRPLPDPPPAFTGLVGDFDISARISRRELKVGESATLKLTVSGRGNSQLIVEPELPPLPSFKIYDDRPTATLDRDGNELRGSKSFGKALVPLTAGELAVPPVELVYFDPEPEEFRIASTEPITLRVSPADGQEDLGLTQSLAPSAGKVSVRIMADDILPLYKGLEAVRASGPLAADWVMVPGLLVPPTLYLAAAVGLARRRRLAGDAHLRRRRAALRNARRRFAKLAELSGVEAAERASRGLRLYVGDKLGLDGGALTPVETSEALAEHDVEERLVERVLRLLERLEAARYGASSLTEDDVRAELAALLDELEKELGT